MNELETKLRAQIFPGREFPKVKAPAKSAKPAKEQPKEEAKSGE